MYTTKLSFAALWVMMLLVVNLETAKAQPCTTTNAAGCLCEDGSLSCTLLPDITISWYALENYANGPTEYSQTGNGVENGRLRVTGSTPNIGFGPFTVRGTDYFICGTDTIYDPTRSITTCPNGDYPTNLLIQRIYHKDTSNMTYTDRWAGGQTYHPGHGHNHVDDWVTFTLRKEDPLEPDTLQWPIIGTGAKIGFCLMDLSNCNLSNGDCRDHQTYGQGTILTSVDFPNYGLGGGSYSCSPVEQGISVGYVDIYSEGLDGMWIDIPPGTCNGDYWIVVEVDPRNNFLESNENNNWTAIPFELTQQVPNAAVSAKLYTDSDPVICQGSQVVITPSISGNSYLWSTGDTTQVLVVADTGFYYVDIATDCGSARSDSVYITKVHSEVLSVLGDTLCEPGLAELSANGTGNILWYESQGAGAIPVDTGNGYNVNLNRSNTYYVANQSIAPGSLEHTGALQHSGSSYSGSGYNGITNFDVSADLTIESVTVYTDSVGERIIELRDINGTVLADTLVMIDTGATTIGLHFEVPIGSGYQLATNTAHNIATFGDQSPVLKRSDSGVSYPYVVPDLISITSSSVGTSFYYYFYDWVVRTEPTSCISSKTPVTVSVASTPNFLLAANTDTILLETDAPITINISPSGGTLSGPGVSQDNTGAYEFSPAMAGLSNDHELLYIYTDHLGCETSKTFHFEVLPDTSTIGIGDIELAAITKVYPNPTNGLLTIDTDDGPIQVDVFSITGQKVFSESITNNKGSFKIDLTEQPEGMYLVKVSSTKGAIITKVIKE